MIKKLNDKSTEQAFDRAVSIYDAIPQIHNALKGMTPSEKYGVLETVKIEITKQVYDEVEKTLKKKMEGRE